MSLSDTPHRKNSTATEVYGNRIESVSYNWTNSATKSNAENSMFFDQEDKAFTK